MFTNLPNNISINRRSKNTPLGADFAKKIVHLKESFFKNMILKNWC